MVNACVHNRYKQSWWFEVTANLCVFRFLKHQWKKKKIIYTVVYETAVKWAAEYLLLSTFKFYFIEQ